MGPNRVSLDVYNAVRGNITLARIIVRFPQIAKQLTKDRGEQKALRIAAKQTAKGYRA
ncbi:MAG: hypothetical protein NTW59_03865 [Candidatus Diapherotrites archaeon]|nr:hypothetical protein [Candidatus Diapherotrites archaeon]